MKKTAILIFILAAFTSCKKKWICTHVTEDYNLSGEYSEEVRGSKEEIEAYEENSSYSYSQYSQSLDSNYTISKKTTCILK